MFGERIWKTLRVSGRNRLRVLKGKNRNKQVSSLYMVDRHYRKFRFRFVIGDPHYLAFLSLSFVSELVSELVHYKLA